MTANNGQPRWSFYLGWVMLNFIAFVVAWYIAWALISPITGIVGGAIQGHGQSRTTDDDMFVNVLLPTIGLLTGILQYTLLRRYLPHMAGWIAATFLGWLMPFATGYLLLTVLELGNDTFSITFGMFLIGATVAVPQWWMLRKRVRYASWWILAQGFGWSVTGLLSSLVTFDELTPVLLAFALVLAIATGFACWLLLDWIPKNKLKSRTSSD